MKTRKELAAELNRTLQHNDFLRRELARIAQVQVGGVDPNIADAIVVRFMVPAKLLTEYKGELRDYFLLECASQFDTLVRNEGRWPL